jgi:PEGA domain
VVAVALAQLPALVHAVGPAVGPTARERVRVVVLTPQLDGDVSAAAAEGITRALHQGLGRGDVEVVPSELAAARCTDPECRRTAVREADATALVVVQVVAMRRDYDVTLTLVDGASGDEVARVVRRCELCGVAELAEHVDGQAASLLARLRSPQAVAATLAVRSVPSGALVRLDDRVLGETPIEHRVELGTHVLRLSLRGYVDELRRFEALAGVREAIAIELAPLPGGDRRRRLRAGGFAALALGSAAAGAGLTLIALHGRPNHAACRGADVDADGDCRYLYATRTPGIVVTSVAAAAIVAGITLLVVEHRARPRPR